MNANRPLTRRRFISHAGLLALAAATGCRTRSTAPGKVPVIDIHQHVGYSGRPDDTLRAHQAVMGVARTILLPSGRPTASATTHFGKSNGLAAQCLGNEACYRLAKAYPHQFLFAANEVPDHPEAKQEIEKYLRLGAVAIAEQKFAIACDAPEMQRLYALAADHQVPILMHWQFGSYNEGFERFGKMLEKFPRTTFIGHAQTWWANIDKNHTDQSILYPKGKVTSGGWTDRYLSDYPNMFGDLSAGSGLNALTRDEEFTFGFLQRHQDKLMYGSDCNDLVGSGTACQGAQTIETLHRLAPSELILRKLLYRNARRVFRI